MTPETPSDPPVRRLTTRLGPVGITDVGQGPALVAVHGLPGSVRDYRWLGTCVQPHLRFVRIDLPASGATPLATLSSPHAHDRADVALAVLDALDIDVAAIVGHSMGGLVAQCAARRWPERFQRVALLASVGRRPHRGFERIPAPHLLARVLDHPIAGRLFFPLYLRGMRAVGFRGHYTREELVHMNDCIAAVSFPANRDTIARLRVPTMVAWAHDDPMVEPEVSRDLSEAAPDGPRLDWPTGGHNIQKSRAVELGDALVDWLSS